MTAAVTFDLFGTLVGVGGGRGDPAAAVAAELADRGVPVPDDWTAAYREVRSDVPDGGELPLDDHVRSVLGRRGLTPDPETVREAVLAAFDRPVERRRGVDAAFAAARGVGPVGLLSNCSVPGLVGRTLDSTGLAGEFSAVVTSADCGWRKPDARAFGAAADALGVRTADLLHVGDDARADGGARAAGGRTLLLGSASLANAAAELRRVSAP